MWRVRIRLVPISSEVCMDIVIAEEHVYHDHIAVDPRPWTWVMRVYPKPLIKKGKKASIIQEPLTFSNPDLGQLITSVYDERDGLLAEGFSEWELTQERMERSVPKLVVTHS